VTGRDAWAHERAVDALRGGGPVVPAGLVERIEALARRAPPRRRPLVPALAVAALVAMLAVVAI
jgi:hypothetical protein